MLALRRAFSSAASSASAPRAAAAGRLLIWGTGDHGKLGLEDANDRDTPEEVPALEGARVVDVACGKHHTAVLTEEGEVWMWGSDQYGQLGHGTTSSTPRAPQRVEALSGLEVTKIAVGEHHSAAALADGSLLTWGYAGSFFAGPGGLGLGGYTAKSSPTRVPGFGDGGLCAEDVSCGAYHTIARTHGGELYSWGRGEWGRLGHGGAGSFQKPERLEQLVEAGAQAAFARESHSVCLDKQGRVWTWGRNEHWQLGYEVTGFLNSGQAFDAMQEPCLVHLPQLAPSTEGDGEARRVALVAASDQGTVAVAEADSAGGKPLVLFWGFRTHFEPQVMPGTDVISGGVAAAEAGDQHVLLVDGQGCLYSFGLGAPVGMPQPEREKWKLMKNSPLDGQRILRVAAGPYTSAVIVA